MNQKASKQATSNLHLSTMPNDQAGSPIDILSLSIPPNFGDRISVKNILTSVPIKKPNKSTFYRVKTGPETLAHQKAIAWKGIE